MRVGAALIPLVGWGLEVEQPEAARRSHLGAIRRLVEELGLGAVELNGDFTILYPDVFDREYYEHVAGLQEELGVRLYRALALPVAGWAEHGRAGACGDNAVHG